ncbi:uncharacterized protein PITG_13816 [Phytophthora infestans T30-4]|uniref:Uncharacterized protein n=1 Tax=Phytophthora infestans (strain T30-4) TaxID=403677 RepID=D0NMV3_PHYIT|nr:uncharacterized protein PITG_13816 [Phytophthora infestans T30-4]EEY61860.1 hypothetical protein PITG_13816 [Phytophthora infestans T30-4]|eukprot:XP_002899500.1 hypothetical protein PITG_13816 [Phytophthora infestans T30-4]
MKESTNQPQQEEEREYIGLHDFRTAFVAAEAALPANSAVRGLMTDKEVIHIFVYFDVDSIGAMKLLSVVEFCVKNRCYCFKTLLTSVELRNLAYNGAMSL